MASSSTSDPARWRSGLNASYGPFARRLSVRFAEIGRQRNPRQWGSADSGRSYDGANRIPGRIRQPSRCPMKSTAVLITVLLTAVSPVFSFQARPTFEGHWYAEPGKSAAICGRECVITQTAKELSIAKPEQPD